jgi:hypothetical protein
MKRVTHMVPLLENILHSSDENEVKGDQTIQFSDFTENNDFDTHE